MDEAVLKKIGIKIGHYTDKMNLTGVTTIIADNGANIGLDIRGSSTATFNTPMYEHLGTSDTVNAVVLTGGSTFGLESVFGVMQYLEEKNIGRQIDESVIPSVTGAVIYDLIVGNPRRPGKREGYQAAKNASYKNIMQGNIGAGTGATIGKWFKGKRMKGGFGMAMTKFPDDIIVCAFVVLNALGDIVDPQTNKFYVDEGGYDLNNKNITEDVTKLSGLYASSPTNTTLAVIATNLALDRKQLTKIAGLAHDGMARAVFPVHTTQDGDVVFALSSLSGERKAFPKARNATLTDVVGLGAQDSLAKAIKNAVLNAESIENFPSYK